MYEHLTKAVHSMVAARNSLRDALALSNPVECLLVLDMVNSACALQQRIEALAEAIKANKNGH
jgi:hypothetical protein